VVPGQGGRRFQYKQVFAVASGRIGLYITHRDIVPVSFEFAEFLEPWLVYWTPPKALFEARTVEEQHDILEAWENKVGFNSAQKQDIQALKTRHKIIPVESVEALLKIWQWRKVMQIARLWIAEDFSQRHRFAGVDINKCLTHGPQEKGVNKIVRVVFATNRKEHDALEDGAFDPKSWFSNQPNAKGGQTIGCASVSVPLKPSVDASLPSNYANTWFAGRTQLTTDDGRLFRVLKTRKFSNIDRTSAAKQLLLLDQERWLYNKEHVALVFVHGYNTSFKNALYRAAQIAASANYPGRVYLFSWPSAADTMRYLSDMDMAERSEVHFSAFLRAIFRDPEIEKVDVVAHSMGAQILVRALSDMTDLFYSYPDKKIRRAFFVAPDISAAVFQRKVREVSWLVDGITIYSSKYDVPLFWSRWLRNGPLRLGRVIDGEKLRANLPAEKIEVIDASREGNICNLWGYSLTDISNSHTYFGQEPVASNLKQLLSNVVRGRSSKRNRQVVFPESERQVKCSWKFW